MDSFMYFSSLQPATFTFKKNLQLQGHTWPARGPDLWLLAPRGLISISQPNSRTVHRKFVPSVPKYLHLWILQIAFDHSSYLIFFENVKTIMIHLKYIDGKICHSKINNISQFFRRMVKHEAQKSKGANILGWREYVVAPMPNQPQLQQPVARAFFVRAPRADASSSVSRNYRGSCTRVPRPRSIIINHLVTLLHCDLRGCPNCTAA
jgi:hypothetical protein